MNTPIVRRLSYTGSVALVCALLFFVAGGSGRAVDSKEVAVVNEPTVHAQQSGAWNVNIDRTRLPFQRTVNFNVPDGSSFTGEDFLVPAGHLLVIEYVSGRASWTLGNTTMRFFILQTTAGGQLAFHHFPAEFNGFVDFTMSQQVRLYADGNTLVRFSVARTSSAGAANADVAISGYLIPVP
jgi:hypothetical protein